VPDVKFVVGKGSVAVDGEARNVIEGSKARPMRADGGYGAPIQRSSRPG